MEPAIKTQNMDKDERLINSRLSSKTFDKNDPTAKDTARQEFALDADINTLVNRFTPGAPQRAYYYGEADYTMDLQHAFRVVQDARHMHQGLTPELREKYPTWQSLLNAVESGEFRVEMLRKKKEASEEASDLQPDPAATGESQVDRGGLTGSTAERTARPATRRTSHKDTSEE